jgi:hypothetical protein
MRKERREKEAGKMEEGKELPNKGSKRPPRSETHKVDF